jgi:hypothetical protein
MEALELVRARPEVELLVRAGEGLEPPSLLDHPQVHSFDSDPGTWSSLDGVLAPAWCESYSPEIYRASADGKALIATKRAIGFLAPSSRLNLIRAGDNEGLLTAFDSMIHGQNSPSPSEQIPAALPEPLLSLGATL